MTEIITYIQANWTVWFFGLARSCSWVHHSEAQSAAERVPRNRRGCPVPSAGKHCSEL